MEVTFFILLAFLTVGALIKFAPAAVLILMLAAVLAAPWLPPKASAAKPATCTTDLECQCMHGGDGYGAR